MFLVKSTTKLVFPIFDVKKADEISSYFVTFLGITLACSSVIIVNEIWHCSSLSNVLYLCVVRSRMSCCPRQYESIAADGQMSTLLPFIAGGIVITWTGLSECRCNMHEILNAPDSSLTL